MVVTQRSALHSVTWLYSHEDAIENASKSLSLISISRLTLALLMHLNSCNKKQNTNACVKCLISRRLEFNYELLP